MIAKEVLSIEWINQISVQNKSENKKTADKTLIEKVIRALLLLEGLSQSNLKFTFKGGTAVMLLLENPKRFSIDIDIIVPDKINFEILFEKFFTSKGFTRVELNERNTSSEIEKFHYKFFYESIHQNQENNILLDILIEKNHYSKPKFLAIDSPFVKQEGKPLTVSIPSIEDIIGDKLTAFAPNTTGIPYKKSMEIMKQLYDIGKLFEKVKDISILSQTFENIALVEMKYRNLSGDINIVLEDIIQTALCICTRGKAGQGDFDALQKGIKQLTNYIFSESYHIEKAFVHASRSAYLATLIKYEQKEFVRFQYATQVKEWSIDTETQTRLNKLKKSSPESFFYWYQVFLLEKE